MAQPILRTGLLDASRASAPLRVAVIGVGRIGRMHAELLVARVPGVALAALRSFRERRPVLVAEVDG